MNADRRILIFGKNGQVGYELCRTLSTLGDIRAIDVDECDLTDRASILEYLNDYKPTVIANAAAYTAVDKAESERALAFKLNADAPGTMADWAKRNHALMIHYSTDYVFNGTKETPWTEDDKPNPLNVYGESKLAGDTNIQNSGCAHFIFRTSWVYGTRGKNFYLTMRKLLQEKDEIKVVNDQYGAPTWCRTIAETTAQVLAQATGPLCSVNSQKLSDVYNLTNGGETTWFGFTKAIKELMRKADRVQKLSVLMPVSTAEYKTAAVRPMHSTLSGIKLRRVFGLRTDSWGDALIHVNDGNEAGR